MISAQTAPQTIQLLWYNTFLLHGFSLTPHWKIGEKPHLKQRAQELGLHLQKHQKTSPQQPAIFALSEVFNPQTFALIYDQFDPQTTHHAAGPTSGIPHNNHPLFPRWIRNLSKISRNTLPIASGLYTLTNHLPITRTHHETFAPQPNTNQHNLLHITRGHPLRDPDFWANKGILLTEIDLGPGKIELFSTHLFSGQVVGEALLIAFRQLTQNIFSSPKTSQSHNKPLTRLIAKQIRQLEKHRHFFDLSTSQRLEIQRNQLQQLTHFIARHHRPENIVILAGDLNLNAHSPPAHALLSQQLASLKQHGIHLQDTRHAFHEPTSHKNPHPRQTTIIHNDILYNHPTKSPQSSPGPWLDYIFIQQQIPQHHLSLQILNQALRPFPRHQNPNHQNPNTPQPPGTIQYLSDHIALELTLRATPKPPQTHAPHSDH